ncbi:unnamed protein product [Ectocarpus sp. 6 AP-2014]
MSSALVDAKALCNDQILDVLNHPMFTIFQIQHDQIAERVDSDNKLLYHFKQSMAKMSEWNSSVVHDFCGKLVKKFPAINRCEALATEMIRLTSKIMDEAHDSDGRYVPVDFAFHDVLHSFIVECSKVFIEHPEWFSHGTDSTEYQTCLNNARIAMKNRDVVYNATRKYVMLTNAPASPSSPSSSSSSSSPSSPSPSYSSSSARPSLISKSFASAEPASASGIYLTTENDSQSCAGGGDDSGNEEVADHLEITKNINVVTGDVETVAVPSQTFQENMSNHLSSGHIMYPGSMNSSSVYPHVPSAFNVDMPMPMPVAMPPLTALGPYPPGESLFPSLSVPPKTSEDGSGGQSSEGDDSEDSDDSLDTEEEGEEEEEWGEAEEGEEEEEEEKEVRGDDLGTDEDSDTEYETESSGSDSLQSGDSVDFESSSGDSSSSSESESCQEASYCEDDTETGESASSTDGESDVEMGETDATYDDAESDTESESSESATDTDTGTEAETGSESDSDTGTETETGSESDSDTGTETGTGTETETDTGSESESESESSSGSTDSEWD